ncbi:MAG TPA: prolyl oligopeptidase family serine peptidase [Bacteroidales bacterium]|nr:S9 family peptidase [Rikenellaceae bacterium]HRR49626.1 prolyl oligopeptidase family serine peptidase [Bacteroidales bacterium]HRT83761.1 prolyl oligopeptidase family serine peptidase [Bacteroidales bacterium]
MKFGLIKKVTTVTILSGLIITLNPADAISQTVDEYIKEDVHRHDEVIKKIDDVLWYQKVGDIAYVDKVRLTGPPRWKPRTEGDRFAGNPLQFYAYTFIPKNVKKNHKYPLIVLPHSGIHADFSTYYAHIVRELISQGYIVVAAEYRGSTGYGKGVYENIDYGGLENEDVLASRDYMTTNYSIVDSNRVAIIGWSHGGMISLFNILKYPEKYVCAFAGVPVSDLNSRLTSHGKSYEDYFTPKYHIGKSLKEDPEEYKRRSPSSYAALLQRPLLIHTNTIDNDVYVEEVMCMIDSLKAHDKKFEYKVFNAAAGGHGFDRIDTKEATDIRFTIYKFLERYLNPPKPFKSPDEMRKAAYHF